MQSETTTNNLDIYLTNAVLQLQNLVPNSTSSSALKEWEKTERAKKVSGIIAEVFADLASYGQAHFENLTKIVALAQQADQMQLLSSYRTTAYNHHLAQIRAFPPDLTITTKDGEIQVNSYLLKKYSPEFKTMLESSMLEGQEGKIRLKDYSSATIQFLMDSLAAKCRHECMPSLPAGLALEITDLAMRYGFADLLHRNRSLVEFIENNPDLVIENSNAWLDLLLPHIIKGPILAPSEESVLAESALEKMTPHLLGIDLEPIEGKYLIPIDNIDLFFHEDTRDLMPLLPVVLYLRTQRDLDLFLSKERDIDLFKQACENANLTKPSTLNILARTYEQEVSDIAAVHGIELNFYQSPIPAKASVYGPKEWETKMGIFIQDPPPIPADMGLILNSDCPFNPGLKVKDTHILVLIPDQDEYSFQELKFRLRVYFSNVNEVSEELLAQCEPRNQQLHWALVVKNLIPESKNKSFAERENLLEQTHDYEIPDLFTAALVVLTQLENPSFLEPPKNLSLNQPACSYAVCQEKLLFGEHISIAIDSRFGTSRIALAAKNKAENHGLLPIRRFF